MEPKQKLLIVLANGSPKNPSPAATAFVYAQTARALDHEVEIHLTGEAVKLAFEGVAAGLITEEVSQTSLMVHIQRAHELGVKLYACGMALRTHHKGEALIGELTGQAGTTAVVGQLMLDQAKVITF